MPMYLKYLLLLGGAILLTSCGSIQAEETATPDAEESPAIENTKAEPEAPVEKSESNFTAPAPTGKSLQPLLADADIPMDEVVTLLPPDAIPAINPEEVPDLMVTATEAENAGLDPKVRVIGVSINGESHAYPIPFLSSHEIINTEVGGRLIAATW